MLDVSMQLGTFDDYISPDVMAHLTAKYTEVLALTNLAYLQMYPDTVALYSSGIRYKEEPFGLEDFFDIPVILQQGHADCEDLAAWRIAEYWSVGQPASPLVTYEVFKNGDILFHVRLITPAGIEDPSAMLGMR